MASIPPNLTRVPNILSSKVFLSNINRNGVSLARVQEQIATGRAIIRASDDIVKASTIGVLDDRLEITDQLKRNLDHARSSLNVLDNTFDEALGVAQEARDISSDQANLTSSAAERAAQATVIDQMLVAMMNIANREGVAGYLLGGSTSTIAPVQGFYNYFRYTGQGNGLTTDTGQAAAVPITVGASAIARASSRVRADVDLNPSLTRDTRLADVRGGRALGVSLGPIELSINSGARIRVETTGSDTIGDVLDRIQNAIRAHENESGTTVLGPGGVRTNGGAISFDLSGGAGANTLQVFDIGTGITGRDLGLVSEPPTVYSTTAPDGVDLNPKITLRTELSALQGVTLPLGRIRVANAGRAAVVDLSTAQTVQDVKNAIEGANLGMRVEINASGTALDVLTEVASGSDNSMSIGEYLGGDTAARLGIRSFGATTRISDMNFGRGVEVVDGQTPPAAGQVNVDLNADFAITLGDASQTRIVIDLRPTDLTTVQNVIDVINNQIQTGLAAAGLLPNALVAGLASDGNGITLTQDAGFPGRVTVLPENNSRAAEQLGLFNGSWDATTRTLQGEDRAKVRSESLFSALVDLREALRANDVSGIALAGEQLGTLGDELAETRGLVGSFQQRVESALSRETDRAVLDEATRSSLRDLDLAEAATRYSLLQTQYQAGLQTTASAQQLSLLDFLR
jgi:flagellar hook-associated protein 3 FlgL